ncbi:hypothetical protein CF319_g7930 [Tilletia indica]|nr:hypothetical protein CF319_g7930 [Tilletia indica]
MATRRSASVLPPLPTEPIVVPDSSQDTNSSFSCTSSQKNDTQDSDADYESQLDADVPVDSQGPTIGEELDDLIDHEYHADVDMEIHERSRQTAPTTTTPAGPSTATAQPDAPSPTREDSPEPPGAPPAKEILVPTEHWRSSDPDHPTINFSEIRECAMPTSQALPANTALYELNHQFNPNSFENVADLRGLIRKRWEKLGGKSHLRVLAMPITGRVRHVHVVFPSVEDFAYAEELTFYWKGKSYKPSAFGPALGPRYTVVTVQIPPSCDPDAPAAAADEFLRQMDHRCDVVRLWSVASAPDTHPEWADFTGHLVAVIHVASDTDNDDTPLTQLMRRVLPAWFRWDGKDYETFFAGRPAWCRLCRGRSDSFNFHTIEDCHNANCSLCQEKHKTQDCPLANADSPPEDPSTPDRSNTPTPSGATNSTPASNTGPSAGLPTPPTGAGLPARPVTPRTPSRLAAVNTPGTTPGASTSATLVNDSPDLMARLSARPVFTSNPKDKGKGKQLSMDNYVRPRSSLRPTSESIVAGKRRAPSTTASVVPALRKQRKG